MPSLNNLREKVDKGLMAFDIEAENMEKYKADIQKYELQLREAEQLLSLFQNSTKAMYSGISTKIGNIITEGIAQVFPDEDCKFRIEFVERRSNIEADLFLEDSSGERYTNLTKEVGGGLIDFISMLLRMMYIMLSPYDNILIADEPLKFVDKERIALAVEFIHRVCEEFNFQILVVSHIPEMIESAEVVYRVEKRNKVSTVTKIR